MKQVDLLKKLLKQPGIYLTEEHRAEARRRLHEKQQRRDKKIMKKTQLMIQLNTDEKDR
jgi:hypothetical protein